MRQFRFWYTGSWTRWFKEGDDLAPLRDLPIEKVEISEELTRKEYNQRFSAFAI
jgi:hypothetical protein